MALTRQELRNQLLEKIRITKMNIAFYKRFSTNKKSLVKRLETEKKELKQTLKQMESKDGKKKKKKKKEKSSS